MEPYEQGPPLFIGPDEADACARSILSVLLWLLYAVFLALQGEYEKTKSGREI